jgi:putative DNA primase/helicase
MRMDVRISDFLSAFFPGADDLIHLRAFKAKGALQGEENKPALIETSRRDLISDKKTQDYLIELNKTRGIYFVVNSGGHSDKDITRFNAFFCECDDLPLVDQHALFDNAPIQPSTSSR